MYLTVAPPAAMSPKASPNPLPSMSPIPYVPAQAPPPARTIAARPSPPSPDFTKSAYSAPVADHHSPAKHPDAGLAKLMRNNSPTGVEKKGATQEIAKEQLELKRSNPIEGVPGRNCWRATQESGRNWGRRKE